jgi:signal transduction histidine kinase
MTVSDVRRSIVGAVAGAGAASLSVWLSDLTGEPTSFVVLVVLAVALVGLGLGAAAALWAYGISGVVIVAMAVPPTGASLQVGEVLRIGAFVIGSPLIILMALRAERDHLAMRRARDESAGSADLARREREAADAARVELHLALQQVERERTRLEEVAEAIPEPLIVYDEASRGTYANRATLRVFGRSFYDREPEEWGRLADPRDERGVALPHDQWPQVRGRREAFRRRMTVRLPMSGKDLLIDVEGTPVPDGGCVLLLRDVGKEVDERRRLSRFASFVAHELRNPLAVAKARIELGNRETVRTSRSVDHGARALESVDAAIAILERLELFSRAEAGSLEADREPFDLRAAVDAGVERLRTRGSEREVRVTCSGDPTTDGDRRLTEQAITNLLTNADRYSTPGEPIDIEIRGGPAAQVRVADAGPGIGDEQAERLFRERVSSGRGLGLGLYLVHAAMGAQGGSVVLEQRRPRAVFLLIWPSSAASAESAAARPPASARGGDLA